jgi:DNA-binding IclR family transcriptional regulator
MGSASGASTVDALAARVRELEQKLAETCHITHPAEDKLVECEQREEEEPAPMKGTVSKTRFFGQSHWMNGADMAS